jgi:UBX domain-containing protein 1
MKTLRDLQAGADDDSEDEDKKRDLFAGGEKSGLAVQDPSRGGQPVDHFRNIMNQAKQNRDRPGGGDDEEEENPRSTAFTGRAQTLGGDDAPSQVVEDPSAATRQRAQPPPRVTRTLHLWADGVSIDDGPLLRFDDPANEHVMQEINQGRAPKALLDVQPDQEVDLNLEPHKGENYVAPKPKYKPFAGQGQRLGSPTPGLASSSTATSSSPAPAAAAVPTASSTKPQEMDVDTTQPTLQLQVRLGDGTRLSSRFNTTHTIGDVYEFVNRASPASQQRPYVLQTTFPSKELADKAQVLGEMNDFKRGGVVIQKWK